MTPPPEKRRIKLKLRIQRNHCEIPRVAKVESLRVKSELHNGDSNAEECSTDNP